MYTARAAAVAPSSNESAVTENMKEMPLASIRHDEETSRLELELETDYQEQEQQKHLFFLEIQQLHRQEEVGARDQTRIKLDPILKRSASSSDGSRRSRVSFDTITVREYAMRLGDHPNCSYGPPVTIDWDYQEYQEVEVDIYEANRPATRRSMRGMMLNYYQRKHILLHWAGHSPEEIKEATTRANRVKLQRSVTALMLPVARVEEAVASAGRKVKRVVRTKHTSTCLETHKVYQ